MRSRALGWLVALWTTLAGITAAQTGEKAPDLARHLPADTLFYVTLPDVAETMKELDKTALAKILSEEEVRAFIAPLLDVWKRMEADAARGMGFELARLKKVEPTRATLALTHLELPPSRADDVGLVVELEVAEGQGELETLLEAAFGSIRSSHSELQRQTLEVGGKPVEFVGSESTGGLYWYRPAPNRNVWTTSRALVDRIVLGPAEGEAALAESAEYQQAMSRIAEPGDEIRAYVAMGRVARLSGELLAVALSESELPEYGERIPAILQALGIADLGAVGTKSAYRGAAVEIASFVQMPAERRGLLRLSSLEPVSLSRLSLIPKEAIAFSLTRVDLSHLLPVVEEVVGAIDPDWHRAMRGFLDGLQEEHEIDVQRDLLSQLGGELIFYDAPARGPIALPSMVFMIGIRDADRFHSALTQLLALAEGKVRVREVPFQDHSLHALSFDGIPLTLQPAFAYHEGLLIGALDIQDLKSAIRRFSGAASSIKDRPDFQRARANLPIPEDAIAVQYNDTAVAVESAYQVVTQVLSMPGVADQLPLPLDLALLPTAQSFTKHLFGSLSYTVAEDGGMYSYSYCPLGPEIYVAVGAMFGLGSLLWVSEGGSELLPSEALAPPRDEQAAAKDDLEQLAIAITFYRIDQGKLPAELADLLSPTETYPEGVYSGKTLPNDPWGRRYVYRVEGGEFLLYSMGPNGTDEKGEGDDITIQ